jgi:hypothetical protein
MNLKLNQVSTRRRLPKADRFESLESPNSGADKFGQEFGLSRVDKAFQVAETQDLRWRNLNMTCVPNILDCGVRTAVKLRKVCPLSWATDCRVARDDLRFDQQMFGPALLIAFDH